jgi:hypothetical protein
MRNAGTQLSRSNQSMYASTASDYCRRPIYFAWPHDTDPCRGKSAPVLVPAQPATTVLQLHAERRAYMYHVCKYIVIIMHFRMCI